MAKKKKNIKNKVVKKKAVRGRKGPPKTGKQIAKSPGTAVIKRPGTAVVKRSGRALAKTGGRALFASGLRRLSTATMGKGLHGTAISVAAGLASLALGAPSQDKKKAKPQPQSPKFRAKKRADAKRTGTAGGPRQRSPEEASQKKGAKKPWELKMTIPGKKKKGKVSDPEAYASRKKGAKKKRYSTGLDKSPEAFASRKPGAGAKHPALRKTTKTTRKPPKHRAYEIGAGTMNEPYLEARNLPKKKKKPTKKTSNRNSRRYGMR